MKRPLVITAAAVLSGILCGLTGIPIVWTLVATIIPVAALIGCTLKSRGKQKPLFFVALISVFFIAAFMRSSGMRSFYEREEYRAFFEKYEATNPGEFNYSLYLKAMGVTNEEERKALKTRNRDLEDPLEQFLGDLNTFSSEVLDRSLSEHDSGIMKAMLLGNKSAMDESVRDIYQGSGISHLLAVSGLHVSLIGLGLFNLLRKRMKMSLYVSAACSGCFVLLYVLFTGASASSVRAGVMFLLSMTAKAAGRKTDLFTSLCAAGMGLLFYQPYLITQSGFLLSFTAIGGIILSAQILKNKGTAAETEGTGITVQGLLEKAGSAMTTCTCVTLATFPIIACSYFKAPLYSILLNMAVIPLMSVVFLSGAAVLMFGILRTLLEPVTSISGLFLWISDAAAAPGHYILLLYEKLAGLSLKLPNAEVIIGRPENWKILLFLALLLAVARICTKLEKRAAALGLLLLFYGLSFPLLKVRETKSAYVTVLDVGQGDCFHVHAGNTDILIDCGSSGYESAGSRIAGNYFLSKGIGEIDVMIVSHADADHTNGLLYLLSEDSPIKTGTMILPYLARVDEKYDDLRKAAQTIPVRYAETGTMVRKDGIILSCVYSETDAYFIKDTNNESSVWLCSINDFDMLFTGDIPDIEESKICSLYNDLNKMMEGAAHWNGRADVLKCAHHGSYTATSEAFLDMVQPETAVLSYGASNRYGHPSQIIVDRLNERNIPVYATAKNGAITFKIGTSGYQTETWMNERKN